MGGAPLRGRDAADQLGRAAAVRSCSPQAPKPTRQPSSLLLLLLLLLLVIGYHYSMTTQLSIVELVLHPSQLAVRDHQLSVDPLEFVDFYHHVLILIRMYFPYVPSHVVVLHPRFVASTDLRTLLEESQELLRMKLPFLLILYIQ